MKAFHWVLGGVATLTVVGCSTHLNPGRCDSTSDCQSMAGYQGFVCNLDPTLQGDGRCVPSCHSSADCQGGRVCTYDGQGVGRCLLPADGAATDVAGAPGGAIGGAGGNAGGFGGEGGTNACSTCGGSTPICLGGTCVECASSADCPIPTKPICDATSHSCQPCSADAQCAAKLGTTGNPGVCMSHVDGHCALDQEAIYVQASTCPSTGATGSAAAPYCDLEPVALALTDTRTLVVIRGPVGGPSWTLSRGAGRPTVSFVGQQSAAIGSGASPAFSMTSGTAYFRAIRFSSSLSVCLNATGGTLDLDAVVVDSCKGGGIYLNGAAFDIENSTISNNGPSTDLSWGGIRVFGLPSGANAVLNQNTVVTNKGPGVVCSGPIVGTGVFAASNTTGDIAAGCGFTSCSPMSATCGAP